MIWLRQVKQFVTHISCLWSCTLHFLIFTVNDLVCKHTMYDVLCCLHLNAVLFPISCIIVQFCMQNDLTLCMPVDKHVLHQVYLFTLSISFAPNRFCDQLSGDYYYMVMEASFCLSPLFWLKQHSIEVENQKYLSILFWAARCFHFSV